MKKILIALGVLALGALACATSPAEPRTLNLYATPLNATQTPVIIQIEITITPLPPVVISATPDSGFLCVTAIENVYLRPTASTLNAPIIPLPFGTRLIDSGSRNGNWAFVSVNDMAGWVNVNYVEPCESEN